MALIDLIGLGADKQAVVFDIGSAFTKIGFAGEHAPRLIISTEVPMRQKGKLVSVKLLEGMDKRSRNENHSLFKDFFHQIYFKFLLVNPKERRVVISESMLNSIDIRNLIAEILFTYYEVVSVIFIPSHLLTLFAVGLKKGLVVDCGYSETSIIPIYEQVIVLNAMGYIDLAGKKINDNIKQLIMEQGIVQIQENELPAKNVFTDLEEKFVENVKVRCCFVGRKDCNLVASMIKYPYDSDRTLLVNGKIRSHATDTLFDLNDENESIATAILDSILKCPIDCRKEMAENIILVGGTTMMAGFRSRLYAELKSLLEGDRYKNKLFFKKVGFCKPIVPENYCSWKGASMFGALETLPDYSISKERFSIEQIIPDWSSTVIQKKDDPTKSILEEKYKWSSMRKSLTALSSSSSLSPGTPTGLSRTSSVSERIRKELGLSISSKK